MMHFQQNIFLKVVQADNDATAHRFNNNKSHSFKAEAAGWSFQPQRPEWKGLLKVGRMPEVVAARRLPPHRNGFASKTFHFF